MFVDVEIRKAFGGENIFFCWLYRFLVENRNFWILVK